MHVLLFCLKKTHIAIYDEILMHIGRQSMDEILAHKKTRRKSICIRFMQCTISAD